MALTKNQTLVLEELKQSSLHDRFYWTGGTLLSEHYLHHRKSEDIDLFSDTPFHYREIIPIAQSIHRAVGKGTLEEKHIFDRWEFFIHNHQTIRFEFVHYPFPALKKRVQWNRVWIDSLEDILANKVMASMERHEPKDVVDLYMLFTKKRYTLKKAIALAQKKFSMSLSASAILGDIMTTCRLLPQITPMLHGSPQQQEKQIQTIIQYFEQQSAEYIHRAWKG